MLLPFERGGRGAAAWLHLGIGGALLAAGVLAGAVGPRAGLARFALLLAGLAAAVVATSLVITESFLTGGTVWTLLALALLAAAVSVPWPPRGTRPGC